MLKKSLFAVIALICMSAVAFAGGDKYRSYYDMPSGYDPNRKEFFTMAAYEYAAYAKQNPEFFGSAYLNETMRDWPGLLGMEMQSAQDYADLLYLVMQITSDQFEALKNAFATGELDDGELGQNAAVKALLQKHDQAVLDYLMLTRGLDANGCFGAKGRWSYKAKETFDRNCYNGALFKLAYDGYRNNIDRLELAMRYAFQYMRLCYYSGDYYAVLAFYEQELADKPDSAVKEWCRSFYGGAQFKTGDKKGAFLSFASVFNRSERYYVQARESLHEIVGVPYNARNMFPAEFHKFLYELDYAHRAGQIAAWQSQNAKLAEMQVEPYRPGENDESAWRNHIKELAVARRYQDIRVMTLDVLLAAESREELEQVKMAVASFGVLPRNYSYMSNAPHDYLLYGLRVLDAAGWGTGALESALVDTVNWPVFSAGNSPGADMYAELEQLALTAASKRPASALWYLGAAHFAMVRGDYAAAQKHLAAAKTHNAERDFAMQYAVSCALAEISLGDMDDTSQAAIAGLLNQLDAMRPENVDLARALADVYSGLLEALAGRYQANGDFAAMFLCLSTLNELNVKRYNGRYYDPIPRWAAYWATKDMYDTLADPAKVAEIMRITQNPATPLEKFLAEHTATVWSLEFLHEIRGLAYIMRFDFPQAQKAFETMAFLRRVQKYALAIPAIVSAGNADALQFLPIVEDGQLADMAVRDYANRSSYKRTYANPMLDNDDDIMGRKMQEDYDVLYKSAANFGLTDAEAALLWEITDAPKSFLEFTVKMQRLNELAAGEGELAAMAAYFYAKALRNIYKQPNWYYGYHRWPQDKVDIMTARFELALAKTSNPELKARIYFMQGALNWWVQGLRQSDYSQYNFPAPKDFQDASSFLPYYKDLAEYADTEFGKEVWSKCPTVKWFLK